MISQLYAYLETHSTFTKHKSKPMHLTAYTLIPQTGHYFLRKKLSSDIDCNFTHLPGTKRFMPIHNSPYLQMAQSKKCHYHHHSRLHHYLLHQTRNQIYKKKKTNKNTYVTKNTRVCRYFRLDGLYLQYNYVFSHFTGNRYIDKNIKRTLNKFNTQPQFFPVSFLGLRNVAKQLPKNIRAIIRGNPTATTLSHKLRILPLTSKYAKYSKPITTIP